MQFSMLFADRLLCILSVSTDILITMYFNTLCVGVILYRRMHLKIRLLLLFLTFYIYEYRSHHSNVVD